MKELTLVILAAGLGSRYGGVKQMEGLGPTDEVLLDYSVFDALRSGFKKVIIVIREEMEIGFRSRISKRFENRIQVRFAIQTMDQAPEGRTKPLGTGHALLSAVPEIDGPFAVINADDFYGPSSFKLLAKSLSEIRQKSGVLIGFELQNTLSEFGSVSRAVCEVSGGNFLTKIEEHTRIERVGDKITGEFNGQAFEYRPDTIVSLNLWGFSPDFMFVLEEQFEKFLKEMRDPMTAEFYLPVAVFDWIQSDGAKVTVIPSKERWLGLTNPEDKPDAVAQLLDLINRGVYPVSLWD